MVDPKRTARIEQLVKRICNELCFYPEALTVKTTPHMNGYSIVVRTHRADMGRLLGQKGRTFRAINTILAAIGSGYEFECDMIVDEPVIGERDIRAMSKGGWNQQDAIQLLADLLWEMIDKPFAVECQELIANKLRVVVKIDPDTATIDFYKNRARLTIMPDATESIGALMLSISLTYRMELIVDFVTRNQMAKTV